MRIACLFFISSLSKETPVMHFSHQLSEKLAPLNLLKHPFYLAWNAGTLSRETLAYYAQQYAHHVEAFPRYLSAIHTQCDDLKKRQILLGNLVDEEQGPENHPQLWLQFAAALGMDEAAVRNASHYPQTSQLVDSFFKLTRSDYATGLGALYAYEHQTPAVAETKLDGLKKHYDITDKAGVQFFEVHANADVWHTQEVAGLLDTLSTEEQMRAEAGALTAAKALWNFLDGIVAHAPGAKEAVAAAGCLNEMPTLNETVH
jgi:pyrroloquinoline-quinone synthase